MIQRFYDKEPTQEFLCAGSLSDLNQTDFNFYPELNHETFLEIEFTSNVVTGFAGFNLTLTPLCDVTHTASSGVIVPPKYPHRYPTDITCRNVIKVAKNQQIRLSVIDNLPTVNRCRDDYVIITSLDKQTSIYDSRDCTSKSQNKSSIFFSKTDLLVIFQSGSHPSNSSDSFHIQYSTQNYSNDHVINATEETTTVLMTSSSEDPIASHVLHPSSEVEANMQTSNGSSSGLIAAIVTSLSILIIVFFVFVYLYFVRRVPKLTSSARDFFNLPIVRYSAAHQEQEEQQDLFEMESVYHEIGDEDEITKYKQKFSKVYVELPPSTSSSKPITAVMATCDLEDDNVSITTNLPSLESRPQTIPNEYTCEYMEQNVNASDDRASRSSDVIASPQSVYVEMN